MSAGGEEGVDFGAADVEEGAEDFEVAHFPDDGHASQGGRAPAEVEEDGFGLVLGVVGEEEAGAAPGAGGLLEKIEPGLAGAFLGEGTGLHAFGDEVKAVTFGEVPAEGLVAVRFRFPEAVVKVAKGQLAEAAFQQGEGEGDGVPPAGKTEEVSVFGRAAGKEAGVQVQAGHELKLNSKS